MYVFLVLSLAMPFVMPSYMLTLYTELLILGLFAISLNIQFGFAGLVTFGHAAFYGLGAYTASILLLNTGIPFIVAVPLAAAVSGIIAVPVGWLCTRAAGAAYAMLTLAVAQTFYAITFKWTELLGGSDGLAGVPRTTFGNWDAVLATREGYFYFVVAVIALAYGMMRYFTRSPMGSIIRGIREQPERAEALGFNLKRYRMTAIAVSGVGGGLAGGLYAPFAGFVAPELLFWLTSGTGLIMAVMGGSRWLAGPMTGAFVFVLLEHYVQQFTQSWNLIVGGIFVLVVIFVPGGILSLTDRALRRKGETL